jgi:hypothetical protein
MISAPTAQTALIILQLQRGWCIVGSLEDTLFGFVHDQHLKATLKMCKPVDDAFASGSLQVLIDEVLETLEEEIKAKKTSKPNLHTIGDSDDPAEGDDDIKSDAAGEDNPETPIRNSAHKESISKWSAYAKRLIKQNIRVVAQGNCTEHQLAELINSSPVGAKRGDESVFKFVTIFYDVKESGEAITSPHDRAAPFRGPTHMMKLLGAVFAARGDQEKIVDGDAYLLFDAWRHGNEAEMMRCFKKSDGKVMDKCKRTVFLTYDEKSLSDRRTLTRGTSVIHQTEFLHIITKNTLNLGPERKRDHFPGTVKGDAIGPVATPSPEDVWSLTFDKKKGCYGSHRVAVGGPPDGPKKMQARHKDDVEPMNFHGMPRFLYHDLLNMMNSQAVISLTTCDFLLAFACLELKIPFFGFTFTEQHTSLGIDWLVKRTLQAFGEEESNLYEPEYATMLGDIEKEDAKHKKDLKRKADGEGGDDPTPPKAPKASAKPKAKAGAVDVKPKAKAKGKAKAKAAGKLSRAAMLEQLKNIETGDEEAGAGADDGEEDPDEEEEEEGEEDEE